jgi:hypothetical protein
MNTDMNSSEKRASFTGWAILELLGHRRLGGFLQEQEIAGAGLLRIDIPAQTGTITQFYSPQALYAITPCSEDVARQIAAEMPQPVSTWDVRALLPEIEATVKSEIEQDVRSEYRKQLEADTEQRKQRTMAYAAGSDDDEYAEEPPF